MEASIMEGSSTSSSALVRDQLAALLRQESKYAIHHVPCRSLAREARPELEDWRRKICQWGFRVIDHFRLGREVVAVGMNIFDRFLVRYNNSISLRADEDFDSCLCPSCRRLLDSRTYQLAAMTCLYLSIKLCVTCEDDQHEDEQGFSCQSSHYAHRKLTFRLQSFAELSRGQFVPQDICDMEKTILQTVQWRVHPPTPMLFVSYMLTALLPVPDGNNNGRFDLVLHVVRELARYSTELAVCLGCECSGDRPSAVALAAILESMDLLTLAALPQDLRDLFRQRAGNIMPPPSLRLRASLRKALWPELIVDSTDTAEVASTRHPISMARDFGLLDVERLCPPPAAPLHTSSPPLSPKRFFSGGRSHLQETSPISVRR